MDRKAYLESRQLWQDLNEGMVRGILQSFQNAGQEYFLWFVNLSEQSGMLKNQYPLIAEDEKEISSMLYRIAVAMHKKGTGFLKEYEVSGQKPHLKDALFCYYVSLLLDDNLIPAYISLAGAFALSGAAQEAVRYMDVCKDKLTLLKNEPARLRNEYEMAMVKLMDISMVEQAQEQLAQMMRGEQ